MKLVAAHNDLTTANVLVDRGGRLGIVDWDTASARTLPLGDLLYLLADAEAAKHGFVDRPAAFRSVLDRPAGPLERRFADTLGLDRDVGDLCFHACWLRHAANEALRTEDDTRPFLEIVRTIAERGIRMGG
jgi:thiamine kinase-like enzyme